MNNVLTALLAMLKQVCELNGVSKLLDGCVAEEQRHIDRHQEEIDEHNNTKQHLRNLLINIRQCADELSPEEMTPGQQETFAAVQAVIEFGPDNKVKAIKRCGDILSHMFDRHLELKEVKAFVDDLWQF